MKTNIILKLHAYKLRTFTLRKEEEIAGERERE